MDKITKKEKLPELNTLCEKDTEEDRAILQEVMGWAREDFKTVKKSFKDVDEVTFLAVWITGYNRGLLKGKTIFDELKIHEEK